MPTPHPSHNPSRVATDPPQRGTASGTRRALPTSGRRRARWWIIGGALAALALIVGAAAVVLPWWLDGTMQPYHATLAAGRAHTCAITSSGGVACWGDNSFGQLGDGTSTASSSPVRVEGLDAGVVALSGSGNHTCAITDAGAVKCWGDNTLGQLGNDSTEASPHPVDVQGLGSGVLAVSAGASHTCALTGDRGVQCWGANGLAQLGSGDAVDRTAPAPVTGLPARVTAVSVGNGFTCVGFTGRTVRCWGDNGDGQLGLGDTDARASWEPLGGLPRTSFVSAGDTHACAVARDGGVWCWGDNWAGQLGDGGEVVNSLVPVAVPDLEQARVVSAGYDRTCAVTASGVVSCWGGLVGGDDADPSAAAASRPAVVEGVEGITDVSVGAFHACASAADGVRCWGSNTSGQLGDGSNTDSASPVSVVGLA